VSGTARGNLNVLFFGPPGAGKGTQALEVAPRLGLAHVSTGDLFRQNMAEGTPLGLRVKPLYDAGQLIPDDLTIAMLDEHLATLRQTRPDLRGILFDGFPRTVPQVESLDAFLATRGERVDAVVFIDVPQAVLIERILGRGRADDTREAVTVRQQKYEQDTKPLLSLFEARGLLRRVNGDQPVPDVTAAIVEALSPLIGEVA